LRRCQARADHRSAVGQQAEADKPRLLLKNHRIARGAAGAFALFRQYEGGADIGMAGERQFGAWSEDAHLRGMRRVLRRQHERGLGQIEFGGDGLHLRAGQRPAIRDDRQRIAAEFAVGETSTVMNGICIGFL